MLKEKRTDTHVYFVNGPFSQWHPSNFSDEDGTYNCAEQYMMAKKALHFKDAETYEKIMKVGEGEAFSIKVPKKQKELGREVKNFKVEEWTEEVACEIVTTGNYLKFLQNKDLYDYLIDTGDRILVEGASYDQIWGVGLAWDNPLILNEKNWRGTNWLGKSLMKVRIRLVLNN